MGYEITMEQNTMEKIKLLEDKVVKVVKTVKQQREENEALQAKIIELEDVIRSKDDEIQQSRMIEEKESERMRQDIASMSEERSAVRSQVEELLKELDSIELT